MLLRDGTTPLGINDDSSSFVAAREREFNEINAAEPGVCDEPTHSGHDPQIATRDIYGYWIRIEARAILLLLLLLPVFRAEYFRFRFWELDDDDDMSGVRGVDRIGEYRPRKEDDREDDRDWDYRILLGRRKKRKGEVFI